MPDELVQLELQPDVQPGVEEPPGKVTQRSPNSYFVLKDNPVLFGSDITNPQQGFDEGGGGTGQPMSTKPRRDTVPVSGLSGSAPSSKS